MRFYRKNARACFFCDTRYCRSGLLINSEYGKVGSEKAEMKTSNEPHKYHVVNANGLKMQEIVHKSRDQRRLHDLMTSCGALNVDIGEGEK